MICHFPKRLRCEVGKAFGGGEAVLRGGKIAVNIGGLPPYTLGSLDVCRKVVANLNGFGRIEFISLHEMCKEGRRGLFLPEFGRKHYAVEAGRQAQHI